MFLHRCLFLFSLDKDEHNVHLFFCLVVYVHLCLCVCQTFVVIDIQIVGSREDGDEGGKTCSLTLPVHTIPEERKTNSRPRYSYLNKKKQDMMWGEKGKDALQRSLSQTETGCRQRQPR